MGTCANGYSKTCTYNSNKKTFKVKMYSDQNLKWFCKYNMQRVDIFEIS